ncbi:apolipoprotein N-acyltransferase [Quadrisphaera sp. GCM10027208]|uniref:apolipoprotein N-acyltransferase n=1 Tax=Quadrisphaera sp. GCM10027208 TaxID=3273423 RepID=UPI00360E35CF
MRAPTPVAPVLPTTAAVVGAVAAGLALDLSFPDPGVWPLAPVGVALLVLSVAGRRTLPAAGLGLLAGSAFFGPLLHWAGIYVGWIAWVPLAVLQALYVALFAAGATWALRSPGGPFVRAVAVAAWWVAVEALRARTPFGGFGWGRLAFSQADAPTLGLAALGGAPLVSFAVALAGGLLAAGAAAALRRRRDSPRTGAARPRSRAAALAVVLATAATVVLAAGALVPRPTAAQAGELRVAAVQGNVPRAGLDFNAERRAVLDNHARATTELAERVDAGATERPDVVLWPENSSDIDPLLNADAAAVIDAAAQAVGAPVLVGAVLRVGEENLANTTLVWEPGTGPVDEYVKQRPVPFAEYVPYREVFRRLTSAVDLVAKDFVAGDEVGLLEAAGTPLGNLICFEVVEDDLVRDAVRAGGELLVVPTNNATFGYTDESVQQLAMSRLRAVEHGRAVAHISTVGVSALIAPDGAVLADTVLFTTAVLEGDLPLRTATTPATRLGEAPELALSALGVLAVLVGAARGRRRGPARPAGRAGARRPGPDGDPDPTGPAGPRRAVTEEVGAS